MSFEGNNDFRILNSNEIYNGAVFNVQKDTILLPNGRKANMDIIKRDNSVAVVAVNENGDIILVRQYRPAVSNYVLEIPAGMIDKGEDPINAAARELEEETAFVPVELDFLVSTLPSVGISNEITYIYLARELRLGKLNPDEYEFIEVYNVPLNSAIEMIYNGEITDSKTIIGILAYKNLLDTKQ